MTLGNKGFNPTIGDLVKIVRGNKEMSRGSIRRLVNISREQGLYYVEGGEDSPLCRQDFEVVAYMAAPAGSKGSVAHDKSDVTARR